MNRKYSFSLLLAATTNLGLFLVKLYIGLRTNSLCIYTDGINNLFDMISLILAFSGTLFLKKAATKKHPFGFGRIEYILEFVMSVIITLTGLSFAYSSLVRLTMPTPVWFYDKYAYILVATCLVKLALAIYFQWKQKKEHSDIFKTVMLDSYMDVAVTAVALTSFTLTNYIGVVVDGFMGLLISILISVSGIKLVCSSVSRLLGTADENLEQKLQALVLHFVPQAQIESLAVFDYGIDAKYAFLTIKLKNIAEIKSIKASLKEEIEKKLSIQIQIAWEEF